MKTAAKFGVLLGVSLLAFVMFVPSGLGQAMSRQGSEQARNEKPAAADSIPTSTPGSDYVIGADDTLEVSVWKEPDLTVKLPVRPDGKISLPLLNDIPAAGLTPMQLKDSITEKLMKSMADQQVTDVVIGVNSRIRVVTGEVLPTGLRGLLP